MKNEITNSGIPAQQSTAQASVDKVTSSTKQGDSTLMRRRRLLKGLGAAPLVITLKCGADIAADSSMRCVGLVSEADTDACVLPGNEDDYLRVSVNTDGTVDGYGDDIHTLYELGSDKTQCLVSVDASGDIKFTESEYDPNSLATNSCWCSFTPT